MVVSRSGECIPPTTPPMDNFSRALRDYWLESSISLSWVGYQQVKERNPSKLSKNYPWVGLLEEYSLHSLK